MGLLLFALFACFAGGVSSASFSAIASFFSPELHFKSQKPSIMCQKCLGNIVYVSLDLAWSRLLESLKHRARLPAIRPTYSDHGSSESVFESLAVLERSTC